MENQSSCEDKGQYWLDRICDEKPSWFKVTKNMVKSFISGNAINLDGLKVQKTRERNLYHPYDIALYKYTTHKYGGYYTLDKADKYIELTGKDIEALYKLHKANKKG
tara:strand:+ start:571 stop:891 length:321 start_codon:yes stop_codon:yes gene_type:complete